MGLRISTLSHVRDKTKKHLSLRFQFKKTFQVSGPCNEILPSKLTNQSAHTDREILVIKSFLSVQFFFIIFQRTLRVLVMHMSYSTQQEKHHLQKCLFDVIEAVLAKCADSNR